jgi:hypothetical protein
MRRSIGSACVSRTLGNDDGKPMEERDRLIDVAEKIAAAIGSRHLAALRELLAPDFVHRTLGGTRADLGAFLAGIEQIPGEIMFVRRDDRAYREYVSEEQRRRRGCIARRMQPDFHYGLLGNGFRKRR